MAEQRDDFLLTDGKKYTAGYILRAVDKDAALAYLVTFINKGLAAMKEAGVDVR